MPELRWVLLLLGVLFLAILAWREWRRPKRPPERREEAPAARLVRPQEPVLTLPEIRPANDPTSELPVLEVAAELPPEVLGAPPPPAEEPPAYAREGAVHEEPAAPAGIPVAQPAPELAPPAEPIVEWPPDAERRVVALRLVAPSEDRFAGRAVRQALAAEGFVSGKLSIFHKAGPDGRALVSAANLTKPGTFDPELMDSQRFVGLNLFSVLPGPLPPREAFEELVASARNLNERLLGDLQDASGQPLTNSRLAALRDELPT